MENHYASVMAGGMEKIGIHHNGSNLDYSVKWPPYSHDHPVSYKLVAASVCQFSLSISRGIDLSLHSRTIIEYAVPIQTNPTKCMAQSHSPSDTARTQIDNFSRAAETSKTVISTRIKANMHSKTKVKPLSHRNLLPLRPSVVCILAGDIQLSLTARLERRRRVRGIRKPVLELVGQIRRGGEAPSFGRSERGKM